MENKSWDDQGLGKPQEKLRGRMSLQEDSMENNLSYSPDWLLEQGKPGGTWSAKIKTYETKVPFLWDEGSAKDRNEWR